MSVERCISCGTIVGAAMRSFRCPGGGVSVIAPAISVQSWIAVQ